MKSVDLSARARADIEDLAQYTLIEWGEGQRRLYLERLFSALAELQRWPGMAALRDDWRPGLRSFPVGRHVIYFVEHSSRLRIVRILHGRMDAKKALKR